MNPWLSINYPIIHETILLISFWMGEKKTTTENLNW